MSRGELRMGTRRSKRKGSRATDQGANRAPVGPDRPAFARSFPRDPELDRLLAIFEDGDYARVRSEAPRLIRATPDDDVRRAARELLGRLDPDPLAAYLLLAAVTLLGVLSLWYWTHKHATP